jgi:hypothetical protein
MTNRIPDDKLPLSEVQPDWNYGPPPENTPVFALAEDDVKRYRIPFRVSCVNGTWVNPRFGDALQTRVIAWRAG